VIPITRCSTERSGSISKVQFVPFTSDGVQDRVFMNSSLGEGIRTIVPRVNCGTSDESVDIHETIVLHGFYLLFVSVDAPCPATRT
jgi:hypothetical protein